jgi:predicted dehydrogenase
MDYRIGIVGGGFLTRFSLISALRELPGARLVAVLDPDPAARAAVAADCPDALVTGDDDQFFDAPLDAVHVATPNYLHVPYALRALERGLAVVVDKPLAHTVESGRQLLAAASAPGAPPALIGYMSKHNIYNREALRLIAAGAIGNPRTMVAARCGWRLSGWRARRESSGLGCLADLGIYPVLTAVDVFGGAEPVRYQSSMWPVGNPDRTDLYAQATVWFGEHEYLHFETGATFNEQPASAEISIYTVVGDAGIIQVEGSWAMNGTGSLVWCDADGWHKPELTPVDPYAAQYATLLQCAATGAAVPEGLSIARALRDLEILYAVADHAALVPAALVPAPR